ncbi:MmcQ/YjbR family DNA-binding protein, partial [bacterium]|nr:MmcQ/YjbR family DNA-binding protein [bacterium]
TSASKLADALRRVALSHPGAEEGVACKGTSLESRAFKAGKKTFLFLRKTELRLKLLSSLPEATKLARKEPGRYEVGANGWTLVRLDGSCTIPLLEKWIDESHRLLAGAEAGEQTTKPRAKRKTAPRSRRR